MDSLSTVYLSFISVITSTISGTIGMGGGVLLLSAMTFFLSLDSLVPIHGVVQLTSNSFRFALLRKHLNKKIISFFALGLPLGAIPSSLLIHSLKEKHFFYLLISFIILFTIFRPKNFRIKIKEHYFFFVGLAVGFLGLFVGATGPFIAPFFVESKLNKEEIVANKACVQTLGHLVKIPAFLALGFDYLNYKLLIGALIICSFVGTKIGVTLLGKINDRLFKKIFKGALIFAAFRLLFKFFHAF